VTAVLLQNAFDTSPLTNASETFYHASLHIKSQQQVQNFLLFRPTVAYPV